jgi:hypothetical protein
MNSEAIQDWLRIRRELLQMETAFTKLAIKVADGRESEELLLQEREVLEATRALCSAAFKRAFPPGE